MGGGWRTVETIQAILYISSNHWKKMFNSSRKYLHVKITLLQASVIAIRKIQRNIMDI